MRKVGRGDRQRTDADFQNKLVDVVNTRQTKLGGRSRSWSCKDPDVIDLKNDHSADVGRFNVLKLSGVVIEPTDNEAEFLNRYALTGVEPDSSDLDAFCITTKPITAGKIAKNAAIVSGMVPVTIDVTDASHTHATAKSGDVTKLVSSTSGLARIIYKESGTGDKLALVRLGGGSGTSYTRLARIDAVATSASFSSGAYVAKEIDCTLLEVDDAASGSGTKALKAGEEVVAWNPYEDTIANGSLVVLAPTTFGWVLIQAAPKGSDLSSISDI